MPKWKIRDIKRQLWQKSQLCGICGKQLPGEKMATLDHIKPISKGGQNSIKNIQLAHWKCNNEKGNKCKK